MPPKFNTVTHTQSLPSRSFVPKVLCVHWAPLGAWNQCEPHSVSQLLTSYKGEVPSVVASWSKKLQMDRCFAVPLTFLSSEAIVGWSP